MKSVGGVLGSSIDSPCGACLVDGDEVKDETNDQVSTCACVCMIAQLVLRQSS